MRLNTHPGVWKTVLVDNIVVSIVGESLVNSLGWYVDLCLYVCFRSPISPFCLRHFLFDVRDNLAVVFVYDCKYNVLSCQSLLIGNSKENVFQVN